jgi:hypothetical protein
MSGRPIFVGRDVGLLQTPGIAAPAKLFAIADLGYVAQQITRMESSVVNDPGLAIGTAKELRRNLLQDDPRRTCVALKKCRHPRTSKAGG